jgi:hypothetical protein
MRANQLRLWLASMAYVLLCALRRIGLKHTQFANATCGTIRLRLLKIGALVRISCRRIKLAPPAPPGAVSFGDRIERLLTLDGLRLPRPERVRPGPSPPHRCRVLTRPR